MKERLKKIEFKDKEVLIIDYTNLKESGLIELILKAKQFILEQNKQILVLSIFNQKTYVTSTFVRALEQNMGDVDHLIVKNAVIGVSDVQRWIIRGINLWYKNQIHPFDTFDAALNFLVS